MRGYIFLIVICIATLAEGYEKGDKIPIYVNRVGPYTNPSETYPFYTLPFCTSDEAHQSMFSMYSLRDAFDDNRYKKTLFQVPYHESTPLKRLCEKLLSQGEYDHFKRAIREFYYFEFIIGDFPVHGFVGTEEDGVLFLFKHFHIHVYTHQGEIVHATLKTNVKHLEELQPKETVAWSYSIDWHEVEASEIARLLDESHSFFHASSEIYWTSIRNTTILAVVLVLVIYYILSVTLRADFRRYRSSTGGTVLGKGNQASEEEYGWKLVHNDVFRPPPHLSLLSAFVANGLQLFVVLCCWILLGLLSYTHIDHYGSYKWAGMVAYGLAHTLNGYISTRLYMSLGGKKWAWNLLLSLSLFFLPAYTIISIFNCFALSLSLTSYIPFWAFSTISLALTLIAFPLGILGGFLGKRHAVRYAGPCRTKKFAREIPQQPWYLGQPVYIFLVGFLPFSALYIDLYYVFSAVWMRATYNIFLFFGITAIMDIIVMLCVVITAVYFQLVCEDYRWWWRAFLAGGASAFLISLYGVVYYIYTSHMNGIIQAMYFFGYTFLGCFAVFLILGSVGFATAFLFVHTIYQNIRID